MPPNALVNLTQASYIQIMSRVKRDIDGVVRFDYLYLKSRVIDSSNCLVGMEQKEVLYKANEALQC